MIEKQINKDRIALVFITVLTVIALVYGFTIIPSPTKARALAFDHKRVVDLGNLQAAIDTYYQNNGNLPNTLNDLPSTSADQSTPTTSLNKTDPQTKQPYVYQTSDPFTYKLCTTFATDSTKEDPNSYDTNNPNYSTYMTDFKHSVGYKCFNKNENDPGNANASPTMSCVGGGCLSTPKAVPVPANPTVTLSSFEKKSSCTWAPTFSLKGFSAYSNITVSSQGTLSDNCDASKTHSYSWSDNWSNQTDQNGSVTVDYLQNDYGNYTYTFTDDNGNSTSIHYSYGPNDVQPTLYQFQPTPSPIKGNGGGSSG